MPEATAIADHAPALELEIDLSKPGRARLLRRLGKRSRGGATNKRELGNSVRDIGSLPSTETTMGARTTSERVAQSLQARTRASSPIAGSASHRSPKTTQLGRLGATAFSDRVRTVASSHCSAYRGHGLPFAPSHPAHRTRTRNHATGLR